MEKVMLWENEQRWKDRSCYHKLTTGYKEHQLPQALERRRGRDGVAGTYR